MRFIVPAPLAATALIGVLSAASAVAQNPVRADSLANAASRATSRTAEPPRGHNTLGFELGAGVGATRLNCAVGCAGMSHMSAGPLLVLGALVHPKLFFGGQAVGSALDDDKDTELTHWAVMPVVKYYPSRLFYVGGGVGYGEAEGKVRGGKVKQGLWSAEARAAWTLPWNHAITPYGSFLWALEPFRIKDAAAPRQVRARSFQIGVALSTPGSIR